MHLELTTDESWLGSEILCLPEVVSIDTHGGLAAAMLVADDRPIGRASARFEIIEVDHRGAQAVGDGPVEVGVIDCQSFDIDTLAEMYVKAMDERTIETEFVAHALFANERGGLHGGIGGWLTEHIATRAVESRVSRQVFTVEARVVFARPVAADGRRLSAVTEVRKLGRRAVVTATTVRTAEGKEVLLADAVHVVGAAS
jgi:uncharacterized protein (TIGR00369 family)